MYCPRCKRKTVVDDSRPATWNRIYRRRSCPGCKHRFTTYEYISNSKMRNTGIKTKVNQALLECIEKIKKIEV